MTNVSEYEIIDIVIKHGHRSYIGGAFLPKFLRLSGMQNKSVVPGMRMLSPSSFRGASMPPSILL